jgi:hypothetical protein
LVARLITDSAERYQIVYSTHSPFMVDWNFPQRIRLFTRDHETGRTSIENKPYAARGPAQRIWDPLRETLGVSLGDITALGEQNVFVEGITDQILLANASSRLNESERAHLDLSRVSIVPFGNEDGLDQLLAAGLRLGARCVILVDSDDSGRTVMRKCQPATRCHEVATYVGVLGRDASIEDLIGVESYIAAVNEAYSVFDWFSPLAADDVRSSIGDASLGAYMQIEFKRRFRRDFSKVLAAVTIVTRPDGFEAEALEKFAKMIASLHASLAGQA